MSVQVNTNSTNVTLAADYQTEAVQEKGKHGVNNVVPEINSLKEVGIKVPALPTPRIGLAEVDMQALTTAVASLGANVLAELTKELAKARRENANEMFADSMAQSKNLKDQSAEISATKSKKLILSILSGVTSIVAGATSIGISSIKLKGDLGDLKNVLSDARGGLSQITNMADNGASTINKIWSEAKSNKEKALIESLTMVGQGASKILDSVGQSVDAKRDATLKDYEAKNRELEALKQQLENIQNSLNDSLRKSFETQSEVARSQNAAMSRMFG